MYSMKTPPPVAGYRVDNIMIIPYLYGSSKRVNKKKCKQIFEKFINFSQADSLTENTWHFIINTI
jgi:hypothetical protein